MTSQLPDFEVLVEMAKKDPDKLEVLRQRMVDEIIDDAAETARQRLMGLQFQIDMVRRKAANPLAAAMRISEMMRDSLADMNRAFAGKISKEIADEAEPAQILKFPEEEAEADSEASEGDPEGTGHHGEDPDK